MSNRKRAFYSVVQYCPDRFRAETVNVGLVLLCPEPYALRVRMTNDFDRARRLFRIGERELANLKMYTSGTQYSIEHSLDEFQTEEGLAAFSASRANDIRLTLPRLAMLEDFETDFERLFSELVDDVPIVVSGAKSQ